MNALNKLIESPTFLSNYISGMSALYQSGIFEALRENGRVSPANPETQHYVEYQAAIANFSIGYNAALDDLLYFREKYMQNDEFLKNLKMDFGGLKAAVDSGDLTEDEANELRRSGT